MPSPNGSLQNIHGGFSELLNENGVLCSGGERVAYVRFIFPEGNPLIKQGGSSLKLYADTTGAAIGDQVRFYMFGDNSSEIKNLDWSRVGDGVHRSGYRIRNLPVQGVNIRYSRF
jgi:hypothetical protein